MALASVGKHQPRTPRETHFLGSQCSGTTNTHARLLQTQARHPHRLDRFSEGLCTLESNTRARAVGVVCPLKTSGYRHALGYSSTRTRVLRKTRRTHNNLKARPPTKAHQTTTTNAGSVKGICMLITICTIQLSSEAAKLNQLMYPPRHHAMQMRSECAQAVRQKLSLLSMHLLCGGAQTWLNTGFVRDTCYWSPA